MSKALLLSKLEDKSAIIGVIGLGYVGLPLLLHYAEAGYKVLGIDIDKEKVDLLNQSKSYIGHIDDSRIKASSSLISATTDFSSSKEADALILCVPTPLDRYREPDLSYVLNTVDELVPYLREAQVLSLESTTYPGTTDEEIFPRVEKTGLCVGKDVFLLYSPEREDPGNLHFNTGTIPKVCGGYTENCLEVGISLYEKVVTKVVPVSSTRAAEMTKLLENIHRSVNIGLANEMKVVADKMGIDIHEVVDAAATKPFGFVPYYPGPGIGGHCIPIDPFYLTWKAREYGLHTRFIELAGEINNNMPRYVMHKVNDALNEHQGKALKGSRILVLGVAYKKNVDDMRESPSLKVMKLLQEKGAEISYSDPHVPKIPPVRDHQFDLLSQEISKEILEAYDCVVLATSHSAFDYDLIHEHASLIIDTRGVFRRYNSEKVVPA